MLPLDRSSPLSTLYTLSFSREYALPTFSLVQLQSYSLTVPAWYTVTQIYKSRETYSHLARAQAGIFQRHLIFPNSTSSSIKEKLLSQLTSTGSLQATRYLGVLLATKQQGILLATRQQGVLLATGACEGNQLQDRALPNDSPFQAICLPYVVNACRIHVAPHKAIAT